MIFKSYKRTVYLPAMVLAVALSSLWLAGCGGGSGTAQAPATEQVFTADVQAVQNIANVFEANNRSMRRVFAETAAYCMGN